MEHQYMDGWKEIIQEMKRDAVKHGVQWTQIKEKFGTLRAYYTCDDTPLDRLKWRMRRRIKSLKKLKMFKTNFDKIGDIVDIAEAKSENTCVYCGKPGRLNTVHYWMVTVCGECEANRAGD